MITIIGGLFLWIIAFQFVCALVGYYISAEKGRGGIEGLLFGLVFGPVGLFLAVLMPEPERRRPPAVAFGTVVFVLMLLIFVTVGAALFRGNWPEQIPAPPTLKNVSGR